MKIIQGILILVLLIIIDPPHSFCAIDQTPSNPNHPHENHFFQHLDHYINGGDGDGVEGHPSRKDLLSEPHPISGGGVGPLPKDEELPQQPAPPGMSSTNPYRILKHFPYAPLYDASLGSLNNNEPEVRFGWRLVISPAPVNNARLVVKRIDESLNLTCTMEYVGGGHTQAPVDLEEVGGQGKVLNKSEGHPQPHPLDEGTETELGPDQVFRLAWHLPIMPQNSKNRVSFQDFHNSKHLIVDKVKESDGGEYECTANAVVDSDKLGLIPPFVESIQILVKPKKGSCNEPLVLCSSGECIAKRFMCDGKPDCKNRDDESFDNCGTYHPCEGKLRCADGRCISPYWCCDRTIDKNCTSLVQSPCCAQLKHIPFLLETHYGPQPQQHYNEMGFLQTTIYTVIGCSMAFMFIITIMVIAICRVHLRRNSALTQMTHGHHHLGQHHAPHGLRSTLGGPTSASPFGDILFNSGGGGMPYAATANGLLVTYNINNGVQFMGRPMNPPPYSEQPSLPPREGPPPPYTSVENLALSGNPVATSSTMEGLPGYSGNPGGSTTISTTLQNQTGSQLSGESRRSNNSNGGNNSNSNPTSPGPSTSTSRDVVRSGCDPKPGEVTSGSDPRPQPQQDPADPEDEATEVCQPLLGHPTPNMSSSPSNGNSSGDKSQSAASEQDD